ncbi:MAG: cytochrome c biogenesis protein CcdA [Flavobacteriaceae bacterium]|jgi:thiol:disulfide interchange protein DsbD|nr:cytochrome c biogenesis protein CcdA [Flavobacteriaceae bacterium]
MKKNLLTLFAFLFVITTNSQILDPVKWKISIEQKSDTDYLLTFDAEIENEWHIFSQFTPDGGSLPSEFIFPDARIKYELVGQTTESEYKKVYSEIFGVDEYMFEKTAQFTQLIRVTDPNLSIVNVQLDYQACKEQCIQLSEDFEFVIPGKEIKDAVVSTDSSSKSSDKSSQRGLWTIFVISFFSGFAALLTPCVFPMIPMTVSFFTKQSKDRAKGIKNAVIFGISIIVIYVALGTVVTAVFGADSLNELSTSVTFNLIFFALLMFFAISFLGAFEIVLPNSWANAVDKQADKGGLIGIFFMALALAIVSFSCTGPIVGTLIVEAASIGGMAPVMGMLGFSLAIALPFMLFALFPGWLNSLPRSGGWLNTVKVSLGFLELALAFKFLSKADLVTQSHLLEREVFLAIWIAVFGAWALYLLGKILLPHDTPGQPISVGRLLMGLLVLSFTIYLVPGLWGAPLKILSGFPPPLYYSESPYGVGASKPSEENILENTKVISHGLQAFTDYETGLKYAKSVNKPVFLDFTGYGCENCRKMEDYVWSDSKILSILKNEVVLISLYVDDKKELPENEKYVSPTTGKKIRTIGNKWSDFQITNYKANAQPYYLILDTEGNTLSKESASYDPDIEKFEQWLREGISEFK